MILELGPTPADEPCVQVGPTNYLPAMREECRRYKAMLETRFPELPDGLRFKITSNPHDFGTYLEVVAQADDFNPEAIEAAYCIESLTPATWDDLQVFTLKELPGA